MENWIVGLGAIAQLMYWVVELDCGAGLMNWVGEPWVDEQGCGDEWMN